MSITVSELRVLQNQHAIMSADLLYKKLQRQKLGFRLNDILNQRGNIIDEILLDRLVSANEALLESDKIRCPQWCSKESLERFISKLATNANNNFS